MSLVAAVNSGSSGTNLSSSKAAQSNFKEVLQQIPQSTKLDPHAELVKLQGLFLSGKKFEPRELLYYQIRASQFGLGVELISKVAESVSAALRKFEQGQ